MGRRPESDGSAAGCSTGTSVASEATLTRRHQAADAGDAAGTSDSRRSSSSGDGGSKEASESSPLSLLTLTFRDSALEAPFTRDHNSHRVLLDSYGCWASLMQLGAGAAFILLRGLAVQPVIMWGSLLLHVVHLSAMRWGERYVRHRTWFVGGLLAFARALTAAEIPGVTADPGSVATRLFYKSGIIPLAWYGITMPLPFRFQLPAQLAAVLLYQRSLAIPACRELAADATILPLVHSLWSAITAATSCILQLQGIQLQPRGLVAAASTGGTATAAAAAAQQGLLVCWSTTSFGLLFVGLILPGPVWYACELRSRGRFFRQQQLEAAADSTTPAARQAAVAYSSSRISAAEDAPVVVAASVGMLVAALSACSCLLLMNHGHRLLAAQL